jgi:hypothetical protein
MTPLEAEELLRRLWDSEWRLIALIFGPGSNLAEAISGRKWVFICVRVWEFCVCLCCVYLCAYLDHNHFLIALVFGLGSNLARVIVGRKWVVTYMYVCVGLCVSTVNVYVCVAC